MISVTLGVLVGLGLLIYYFMFAGLLWTIGLFLAASFVAGIVFAILDRAVGLLVMSLVSFLGWPLSAFWLYLAIRNLPP